MCIGPNAGSLEEEQLYFYLSPKIKKKNEAIVNLVIMNIGE